MDLLDDAAFKAALRFVCLERVIFLDDNRGHESGPQNIPSMAPSRQLTGEALLDLIRIMLSISSQLSLHPDDTLTHRMFVMMMEQLVQLLQRPKPIEFKDPQTFWTFMLDSFFALGSLNTTPATINVTRFQIADDK